MLDDRRATSASQRRPVAAAGYRMWLEGMADATAGVVDPSSRRPAAGKV